MKGRTSLLLALSAMVVVASCSDSTGAKQAAPSGTSGGTVDTSGVAPNTVNLSGHVFAVQATPGAQGSDTLRYIPVGGVSLRLMHNILVNGQSAQEPAGTTVSGADGTYSFPAIAGGYYVLYAEPSAASGYAGAYSLVPAQSASVTVDVFVWRR
jgi:hypothetical protein